jgi:hypothetical protein
MRNVNLFKLRIVVFNALIPRINPHHDGRQSWLFRVEFLLKRGVVMLTSRSSWTYYLNPLDPLVDITDHRIF